jgi:hypothetical protein
MSIEAITVCVGYGDFLRETLPANLPLVDDLVVITSPDDHETRSVCKEHSVRHVLSEEHGHGGPFNKGRLINRLLDQVGAKDWVLHLDADIVLPRSFRRLMEWAHPDERCLYGADRATVPSWQAWCQVKAAGGWDNHRYGCMLHVPEGHMTGGRHVPSLHGYTPIGFFQLFHGSQIIDRGFHLRRYPITHGDAARTDVQFALQWDRQYRRLLPEVVVLHIESDPKAPKGANWKGRTTPRFGPPWHHRHHHHHHGES